METAMKIQVIKKADKKTAPSRECAWFVEGLPEPRK
jgi:hypothetical protein